MGQTQNIVEQFELAVNKYPNHAAVRTEHAELTYEQLNKRANRLAHLIRSAAEYQENKVALLLDHNEDAIVGILGTLKAGKAYVPIDPLFPLERCRKILNDSGADTLVTTRQQLSLAYKLLSASEKEIKLINLSTAEAGNEANPGLKVAGEQDAYVLYTSGSTGQPKGVVQSHHNVVAFMHAYVKELDINASDNVLLTTPYSHTVSVIDVFSALFSGATISLLNVKKDFEVQHFAERLQRMGVTIIHTVPTFYRYFTKGLTDKSRLSRVRLVILGGEEVFDRDVAVYKEDFPDHCLFINLYGSSEVILGTLNVLNKESADDRRIIPIGYPFDVLTTVILDEHNREVPTHGIGELYLGAAFLNPRYHKDPRGTAALFMTSDACPQERLVKTGDLVKRLPDGSLQLIGRKDNQIKINGNRVHLNEIEVNLNADEAIEQSVVIPVKNDAQDVYLVAYVKAAGEKPNIETVKENLRKNLPEYMIPSFFVRVEKIPTTANGKIDRKSLPRISYQDLMGYKEQMEKTELQKSILKIWKNTFDKEDITVHDSFFRLGGNSLMATEIVNKISVTLNIEVELSAVFDHQSVFEMARYLEGKKAVPIA